MSTGLRNGIRRPSIRSTGRLSGWSVIRLARLWGCVVVQTRRGPVLLDGVPLRHVRLRCARTVRRECIRWKSNMSDSCGVRLRSRSRSTVVRGLTNVCSGRAPRAALLALDAQLGWPQPIGPALIGHAAREQIAATTNPLFRRTTNDSAADQLGKRPSMSAPTNGWDGPRVALLSWGSFRSLIAAARGGA